jgi:hypothetical protein
MNTWILFAFITKELSIIGQFLMNVNILAPKIGALHRGSQKQNCDSLENGNNDFD